MNEGMTSAIHEEDERISDEDYQGHEFVGGDIQNDQQSCQEEQETSSGRPFLRMMFETMIDARQHYVDYGKSCGFSIRTRTISKTFRGSNKVTGATFVCSREGKPQKIAEAGVYNVDQESLRDDIDKEKIAKKKMTTSTVRVGCVARLRVFIDKSTVKWKVTDFYDAHNHNFVSPSKKAKMRPLKEMPKAARDLAEAFRIEGLSVGKVPAIFGGNFVSFDSKDCWNHMVKARERSIGVGDAVATLNYFRKKLAESPRFYYAVQYDEEGRAANLFWVDARS